MHFKPKIGNVSLHEISNYNGVRVVNFAILSLVVKSKMFSHRNVRKFTCHNILGPYWVALAL
jgi:hypothetical protein